MRLKFVDKWYSGRVTEHGHVVAKPEGACDWTITTSGFGHHTEILMSLLWAFTAILILLISDNV